MKTHTIFIWIEAQVFISYKTFLTWHLYKPFLQCWTPASIQAQAFVYMIPAVIKINMICKQMAKLCSVHKSQNLENIYLKNFSYGSTHITGLAHPWGGYLIFWKTSYVWANQDFQ